MSTTVDYPGVIPPPPGRTVNMAYPEDVLNTINTATHVLCTLVMTPFVLTRIYAKWRILPPFNIDDWCCVITYILSLGHIATAFGMGAGGGGFNLWEVTTEQYMTFNKSMYADTLVYGPNTWFLKVTLLLAIIRVFNVNRRFVIFTYCFIGGMAAYYLPVLFIKIMICRPIRSFWNPSVPGQCFNNRPIFVADTTISAVTDLAVLLMPIPLIVKLQMPWQKKFKAYLLLGAGGVATAASFIRMVLVIRMQKSQNPTVDFIRFNMPCTAEVTIGLVCACLPAMNKALKAKNPEDSNSHKSPFFASRTPKFLQRKRPKDESDDTDLMASHCDLEKGPIVLRPDAFATLTQISSTESGSKPEDFVSSTISSPNSLTLPSSLRHIHAGAPRISAGELERPSPTLQRPAQDLLFLGGLILRQSPLPVDTTLPESTQPDGIQVTTTTHVTFTGKDEQAVSISIDPGIKSDSGFNEKRVIE